jgi:ribosomal protein L18E
MVGDIISKSAYIIDINKLIIVRSLHFTEFAKKRIKRLDIKYIKIYLIFFSNWDIFS